MKLRVTEIFLSLQGETRTVGIPTVFVRLTGCPLRCQYCDTAYAFQGGELLELSAIIEKIQHFKTRLITVTGGEPLAQKESVNLLKMLCDAGYEVSLETSGALSLEKVDPRVVKVMDLKTPGSKEAHRNYWPNLNYLLPHDQIKFVICNKEDYEWSKKILFQHGLHERHEVLFSPSYTQLLATELADWILADRLPVRFQMQLHKVLWGNEPGR
jgi:7-carboxy-7-deazaguanine synthase